MEEIQTRVIESSDSDCKKLMTSAVPESTKKSLKYAVNVLKVKKVTSRSNLVLRTFKPSHFIK